MSVDNWINVFTALGTFAAVAVALWLGIDASRKAKGEAQVRAKLAAASISARLAATSDAVGSLAATSVFLDLTIPVDAARHKALADIRREMNRASFRPDDATLLALTPLPNNCAHRIARAFDYIERVRLRAQALPSGSLVGNLTTPEQREHMFDSWNSDLRAAYDLLQVALRECVTASDLGAPMPSGQELHGPDRE